MLNEKLCNENYLQKVALKVNKKTMLSLRGKPKESSEKYSSPFNRPLNIETMEAAY